MKVDWSEQLNPYARKLCSILENELKIEICFSASKTCFSSICYSQSISPAVSYLANRFQASFSKCLIFQDIIILIGFPVTPPLFSVLQTASTHFCSLKNYSSVFAFEEYVALNSSSQSLIIFNSFSF